MFKIRYLLFLCLPLLLISWQPDTGLPVKLQVTATLKADIGEGYISTGSLYLCSEAFLILGLPSSDEFWQKADEDWTAKKVWKGEDIETDHAID